MWGGRAFTETLGWCWALCPCLRLLQRRRLPETSWHFPDDRPEKSHWCQAVWDLLPAAVSFQINTPAGPFPDGSGAPRPVTPLAGTQREKLLSSQGLVRQRSGPDTGRPGPQAGAGRLLKHPGWRHLRGLLLQGCSPFPPLCPSSCQHLHAMVPGQGVDHTVTVRVTAEHSPNGQFLQSSSEVPSGTRARIPLPPS